MDRQQIFPHFLGIFAFLLLPFYFLNAQMITGIWHGKIDKQRVEVKIIQNGDSLSGTSYYYESAARYRRYSIKGFFDANDNSVVWWDDQLIEDKTKELNLFGKNNPSLSRADFNCPGGGVMKLDGKTYSGEDQQKPGGDVHLDKVGTPSFNDEWDFVIENYMMGTNDPDVIDSISLVAKNTTTPEKRVETTIEEKKAPVLVPPVKNEVVSVPVIKQENKTVQKTPYEETKITPPTIEEKFTGREKVFIKEIPLTGDSIELDFYDNGEIDGDSISLFLNGKLIF